MSQSNKYRKNLVSYKKVTQAKHHNSVLTLKKTRKKLYFFYIRKSLSETNQKRPKQINWIKNKLKVKQISDKELGEKKYSCEEVIKSRKQNSISVNKKRKKKRRKSPSHLFILTWINKQKETNSRRAQICQQESQPIKQKQKNVTKIMLITVPFYARSK